MPFGQKQKAFGERRDLDDYETPAPQTEALLRHVEFHGPILEPAAGTGKMARVLRRHGHSVETADIKRGRDFLERTKPCMNIVTNPPYHGQMPFLFAKKAMELATGKIALLVKPGFLWGKTRREWLNQHRPYCLVILCDRILFTLPDGSPIKGQFYDHMWIVWNTQHLGYRKWEIFLEDTTSWRNES